MKRLLLSAMIVALTSSSFGAETGPVVANVHNEIPQPANAVIPPVVKETYEYYEVCGQCETDLKCQLKQKCITWKDGRKYDALTSWKMKWDYGHNRAGQTCSPDSFTVTVNIRYQLPRWAKPATPPHELVEKWESYTKNLMAHESGHRDLAVEAATELITAVVNLPPSSTCAELDRNVNFLSRARMRKLEEEQRQYDRETSHGATQGALFP